MSSAKCWLLIILLLHCGLLISGCSEFRVSKPINIANPGADLANYPNSAYTLPQGHAYIEITPVNYSGEAANSPQQYNAGYLMRYGLIDSLELRMSSEGFIHQDDKSKDKSGLGPQIFGIKWHLTNDVPNSFMPAIALEANIQSNWASAAFKNGTQPAASLNFDKDLPYEISAEFNINLTGYEDEEAQANHQLVLSWALQHSITDNVAFFINGYSTATNENTSAIGAGAQWLLNKQLTIFTNLSAG